MRTVREEDGRGERKKGTTGLAIKRRKASHNTPSMLPLHYGDLPVNDV